MIFKLLVNTEDYQIVRHAIGSIAALGYKVNKNSVWASLLTYIDEYLSMCCYPETGIIKLCFSRIPKEVAGVSFNKLLIIEVDVDYLVTKKKNHNLITFFEHFDEVIGYPVDIAIPK